MSELKDVYSQWLVELAPSTRELSFFVSKAVYEKPTETAVQVPNGTAIHNSEWDLVLQLVLPEHAVDPVVARQEADESIRFFDPSMLERRYIPLDTFLKMVEKTTLEIHTSLLNRLSLDAEEDSPWGNLV